MGLMFGLVFMFVSFAIILVPIYFVYQGVKGKKRDWACPRCGFSASGKFCGSCGAGVDDQPSYGGFSKRAEASLLDGLIMIALFAPFAPVYFVSSVSPVLWLVHGIFTTILFVLIEIVYIAHSGQTPGKYLVGLRIVSLDLKPIGLWAATKRVGINIFSSLTLYLAGLFAVVALGPAKWEAMTFVRYSEIIDSSGFNGSLPMLLTLVELLTLLTNSKRRALHDFIGGTVVVDEKTLKPGKVPLKAFKWWPFGTAFAFKKTAKRA